ncbi:PAS domain S-box protein [Hahella sp. CR1]|uniref:PAS domain S-box protein n=1 Tax=Hahella sp. CR1 TaxID=2992807 RepID=UPI002440F054|nr:PAS domain S-box protein [Hahella sp. CR1]MDG9670862.1 PAS domain S-box protein [Hahella sp. CR1]
MSKERNVATLIPWEQSAQKNYFKAPNAIGLFTAVIGFSVLFGWLLDINEIKSLLPGLATMKANTALCFILSGMSLYHHQEYSPNAAFSRALIARACAGIVCAISFITLVEYGFGGNLGIDELLLSDSNTAKGAWPGRMSLATALAFMFTGSALLLIKVESKYYIQPAQIPALLTIILGGASLIGYIYGIKKFQLMMFSTMAIHTAALFVIIGIGIFMSTSHRGFIAELNSQHTSRQLALIATLTAILTPLLVGWLTQKGIESNMFSVAFGLAINCIATIIILSFMVFVCVCSFNGMQTQINISNCQKSLLASIVDSSADAIISKDIHGNITSWNSSAERIFGYTKEEVLGKPVNILFPKDHLKEEKIILEKISRGERVEQIETLRRCKDGSLVDMSITVSPIIDEHGVVIGASNVGHDITERKRNHERIRLIVDSAPSSMIMVDIDHDGRIVMANSQTEKMFGYSNENLVGQKVETLFPKRIPPYNSFREKDFLLQLKNSNVDGGKDTYALRADSTEFPVEVTVTTLDTRDKALTLISIVDITERKLFEENILSKTRELERSNRDLEQFAYVASHDLQEPLRAISGCVQLLKQRYQGQIDSRADEYISHTIDGTARMQALIDDLLLLSRLGKPEDKFLRTDLNKSFNSALGNLFTAVEESNAKVICNILPVLSVVPTQIILLFQNLVSNAIKFRRTDQPLIIEVNATEQPEEWCFSVKDNGIGIEAKYFQRIFEIFQRLHTRREYKGTGIGLSLCKRIVEHHNGSIWVESTLGQGTTIYFTLKSCSNTER